MYRKLYRKHNNIGKLLTADEYFKLTELLIGKIATIVHEK